MSCPISKVDISHWFTFSFSQITFKMLLPILMPKCNWDITRHLSGSHLNISVLSLLTSEGFAPQHGQFIIPRWSKSTQTIFWSNFVACMSKTKWTLGNFFDTYLRPFNSSISALILANSSLVLSSVSFSKHSLEKKSQFSVTVIFREKKLPLRFYEFP